MRDLENGTVEVARRDDLSKSTQPLEGISEYIESLLEDIQTAIYNKALTFRTENTVKVDSWEGFLETIEQGKFILAHWDGTAETEEKIKELTKATIRCIPFDSPEEAGACVLTGAPSSKRVIFARSY
jgi:prolyl-tRNA synthetase